MPFDLSGIEGRFIPPAVNKGHSLISFPTQKYNEMQPQVSGLCQMPMQQVIELDPSKPLLLA